MCRARVGIQPVVEVVGIVVERFEFESEEEARRLRVRAEPRCDPAAGAEARGGEVQALLG